MVATTAPRVVVVARSTEYSALVARHGTRDQARFFLATRGRSIDEVEARHSRQHDALATVSAAIPVEWRRASVARGDLDRFLFDSSDIVITVGQSGLVANVAKYLSGQPVIGISPDPARDGAVLAPHAAEDTAALLHEVATGSAPLRARTMVEARLDDGQRVLALNEIFVGHASHQSARYLIRRGDASEHQSSSGVVVTTGTGATGWGRSISLERGAPLDLAPDAPRLCYYVREAWPSPTFGTALTQGLLEVGDGLEVVSELDEGGVIFGDGIESDRLVLGWGMTVRLGIAPEKLRLLER